MVHLLTPSGGVVPPLSTPMTESFEVDITSLQRLIEFQLNAGVHGIFVLGTTSEAVFLTDEQRATVLDVAMNTIAGQVPLFAGIIDMTTARVLEHVRVAQRIGVDGVVLTAPFYMRTSQIEIVEHFRIVHSSIDLPLLAYNIPMAVHTKIEPETIIQMAHEGLIQGVKDSSGDDVGLRTIIMELGTNPDFLIFTGSERLVDTALLIGASGAVPGLANIDPHGYIRLYQAARAGDWRTARYEQERLFRLFSGVTTGTAGRIGAGSSVIGGYKTALMLRGVIKTNVTGRPQIRLNGEEVECVRRALIDADLL